MRTLIKFFALILFGFMTSIVLGQQESTKSGFVVHFDIGWNFLGPSLQMNDHMIEHGFNQTIQG